MNFPVQRVVQIAPSGVITTYSATLYTPLSEYYIFLDSTDVTTVEVAGIVTIGPFAVCLLTLRSNELNEANCFIQGIVQLRPSCDCRSDAAALQQLSCLGDQLLKPTLPGTWGAWVRGIRSCCPS